MAAAKVSRLIPRNSALFLCDIQEKFRPTVSFFDQIISVTNRMSRAATILNMKTVWTEQYPKGLGPTVTELIVPENAKKFEKTCFSMVAKEVDDYLKTQNDIKSVVLCGIETHACIYQTTMDLLEREYRVHLIVDAISSRNQVDRFFAFRAMERAGAVLQTSECALLDLLRDSKHEKFREIQALFKDPSPDSGLLNFSRL